MKPASTLLLALSVAFLVVACGGGSGTPSTETTTAGATPSSTPTPTPSASPDGSPTPSATPAATTPTSTPAPTSVYRLVGSYDKTECVFDSSTGLTWEGKPTSGFRVNTNTYTNYDDATKAQKGTPSFSTMPTQLEVDALNNTIGYVAEINRIRLCGYSDWRLPSYSDLLSINIHGQATGNLSLVSGVAEWFPNTSYGMTWTSTPDPLYDAGAQMVWFGGTGHYKMARQSPYRVRLVR